MRAENSAENRAEKADCAETVKMGAEKQAEIIVICVPLPFEQAWKAVQSSPKPSTLSAFGRNVLIPYWSILLIGSYGQNWQFQ